MLLIRFNNVFVDVIYSLLNFVMCIDFRNVMCLMAMEKKSPTDI